MATTRDVIRQEIDQKLQPVQGQQVVELLPLDERKGDKMYFAGPPEMVYVKVPSGASMRLSLIDTGVLSNELMSNPERFRIKIEGPYYKLPMDPDESVAYGELVRIPDIVHGKKKLEPMLANPVLGHSEASQTVKTVEIGDTAIKVGDKGDIQFVSRGEAARTITPDVEIRKKPQDTTVIFGGDMTTLFKSGFIAGLIPRGFFPPFSVPNNTVNSRVFETAMMLLNEAIDIAMAIKHATK